MPAPARDTGKRPAPSGSARVFAWAFLGVLLVQAAWTLVVPPFRGLDEHEHVFRAAAVAHGDWGFRHEPTGTGRSELVEVPTTLAEAALPVCRSLAYVRGDCEPRPTDRAGTSSVGSSAARYNPVYYAVVGTLARPFEGYHALYAMRVATMVGCALLMAYAFVVLRLWARSSWVPATFVVAATPITFYSESIVAPNGVELAAAFLVWSGLLGLSRVSPDDPRVGRLLVAAAVGAVPLAIVRTLGPLWLVLIVLTCAALVPRDRLVSLARRRATWSVIVPAALLAVCGPIWTLLARPNTVTDEGYGFTDLWSALPGQWVLWFFQSIAAFPSRDDMAPLGLYVVALATMWVLAALALRSGTRRERWALLGVVVAASAVPLAVTISSYAEVGPVWQGRYGYPFALGFFLICGAVLDRSPTSARAARVGLLVALTAGAVAELVGLHHVLTDQLRSSPLSGTSAWPAPSTLVLVALVLAATAALSAASLCRGPGERIVVRGDSGVQGDRARGAHGEQGQAGEPEDAHRVEHPD